MQLPDHIDSSNRTPVSGEAPTRGFAGPTLHTERLMLVPIRPCDYVPYRAFIMSDRARYIGGPFEDEGRAWRTFASMIGHWHLRGFGLFSVIMRANDQLMGFIGNWWPVDFPEREIGWTLLAPAEGKGIAFEAAREVQRHSFHTLGWPTAVSYIHRENTRSIRLAKRLGAVRDTNAAGPQGCDLVYRHMPPGMSP